MDYKHCFAEDILCFFILFMLVTGEALVFNTGTFCIYHFSWWFHVFLFPYLFFVCGHYIDVGWSLLLVFLNAFVKYSKSLSTFSYGLSWLAFFCLCKCSKLRFWNINHYFSHESSRFPNDDWEVPYLSSTLIR